MVLWDDVHRSRFIRATVAATFIVGMTIQFSVSTFYLCQFAVAAVT